MPGAEHVGEADRSDEERERLNRELTGLLNELRVAMPGVQVLFAFLLAVPFQQRFAKATAFQRDVQQHQKECIINLGTREFLCGLVALAVAMTGAVLLVTDLIFQTPTVIVATVGVGCLFVWLWFGLGPWRRLHP